tara:strand:+ start:1668 stop:3128 length:1461 start_codon:yes stop_codon:yes gene_type:complete
MAILLSTLMGTGGTDAEKDFNKYAVWAGRNPYYGSGYKYNDSASATGAEVFTIQNGSAASWSVPTGVSRIRITTIGAGGSGGSRYGANYHGGGGGGGAAFAVAEYSVTAGQTLNILASNSAQETRNTNQYNGSQSYVQSASDGGAAINIYAGGGTGGSQYTAGSGSSSKSAGGSAVDTVTKIESNGGNGGSGSTASFGFGPEPYGAGGGGAAGYVVGNGGNGGSTNTGGYSTFSAGGGAVGGKNGGDANMGASSSSNHQYSSGSGGGTGSAGANGDTTNNPKAGGEAANEAFNSGKYPTFTGSFNVSDHAQGQGKNAEYAVGGSSGTNVYFDNSGGVSGGGGAKQYAWPLMAKAYQAGGGGGSGYSSYQYSHPGGDGGVGAGGGGGGCYNQNAWGSHQNDNGHCYFDYARGAYVMLNYAHNPMGYNARGGHGGAFGGGGGGGGYYGDGGGAGYGAGGGGGGGHFQSSVHGFGGFSGPGLVVIEWKA